MIFERLTLHNFLRYGGTSSIQFPTTQSRKLVILLAPNNTGKTTILRALEFLLYGSLSKLTDETCWQLITEVEREKVAPGEEITAYVEGVIRFANNEIVTLKRVIKGRRVSADKWQATKQRLYLKKNSGYVADENDYYQSKIDSAVPINLFSWFYFQGEPADGKMGNGNHPALMEPLKKVLQLRRWTNARNHVTEIIKSLKQEEAKAAGANQEYLNQRRKHDVIKNEFDKNNAELTSAHAELSELKETLRTLERQREQVSQQALETQELYKKQAAQQQIIDRSNRAIIESNKAIRDLINARMGIPLLATAFAHADQQLAELRERNLLPADVSKGFIKRLMGGKQCVCGTCLDEQKMAELEKYLSKTLTAETNRDLVALADSLDGGDESPLRKKSIGYQSARAKLIGAKSDACKSLNDAKEILDNLNAKVEESAITQFVELSRSVANVQQKIFVLECKINELEQKIRQQKTLLDTLAESLRNARPRRGAGELEKTAEAIQIAENLVNALQEGEAKFKQSVHQILQSRLSHYFGVATSGNVAVVDRDTFLPMMKNRNGELVNNPGGGEQQVLNLAFVVALAEMRNIVNDQLRSAGLGASLLGDQSFFLDSPFTSADPNFMKAIADFLPGKAPQMMLLLAKQNWTETIRETLEPHIELVYGTTLHTPVEPADPEAFVFRWKNKDYKLIEKLPPGSTSYSTFQQL
jgi:DNA sulfur modification protein DndD